MKRSTNPAFETQLRAARQAVARQLFRLFPTSVREDISDAISAATETLLNRAPLHVSESTEAIYCYLLTTATRNLLHEHRRAKRLTLLDDNSEQSLLLAAIPADDSSDTAAAEAVLRELIEQRIGRLNAAIVCMRVFDRHSIQYIADTVNITVKAAYNRYERSLPKLLDIVVDSPPPPPAKNEENKDL